MKKSIILMAGLLAVFGCKHDIVRPSEFQVTLDEGNSYLAGEPVRFNFSGEVENIIFYSGETGHQYKYKDRYTVPQEDVQSISLNLQTMARYGLAGAMEIWVTNKFEGLKGDDGAADRATVKAMVEGGMQGWTKLPWEEGASTKWANQTIGTNEGDPDLGALADNFCIAFHWCPPATTSTQRTYWVNGSLHLEIAGTNPTNTDITKLNFKTVMMNEELDPYHVNKGNGSIVLNNPNTASLIFQGVGANALSYCLDGWAISTPSPLNRVANDQAIVIKDMQNYLHHYEYVFAEPGEYDLYFVGSNNNYMDKSSKTVSMKVTIK